MLTRVPAPLSKVIKWILRLPADALVLSSRVLHSKVSTISMSDPSIAAKFYPVDPKDQDLLLQRQSDADFVGHADSMSVLNSAKLIHRLANTGRGLKLKFIPMSEMFGKYEDIQRRRPDLSKSSRILAYQPKVSVEEFIRLTIEEPRREYAALR